MYGYPALGSSSRQHGLQNTATGTSFPGPRRLIAWHLPAILLSVESYRGQACGLARIWRRPRVGRPGKWTRPRQRRQEDPWILFVFSPPLIFYLFFSCGSCPCARPLTSLVYSREDNGVVPRGGMDSGLALTIISSLHPACVGSTAHLLSRSRRGGDPSLGVGPRMQPAPWLPGCALFE